MIFGDFKLSFLRLPPTLFFHFAQMALVFCIYAGREHVVDHCVVILLLEILLQVITHFSQQVAQLRTG